MVGPCELASEPVCTSPRVVVADRAEELVDSALSEIFIERDVESLSGLDISSTMTSDGVGGDAVAHVVDQGHLGSDLGGGIGRPGIEDGNMICDCHVPPDCDKEAAIVKEPFSSLDNCSPTSDRGKVDSVVQVFDQVHLGSELGGEIGLSGIEDGNTICDHGVPPECDKEVAIAKEPVSSLGNSLPTSDRGGGDSVAQVVDQVHLGSDLGGEIGVSGIEDGNTICDHGVPPDCDKEAAIPEEPVSTSDRCGGDSVAQVVDQGHLGSDLGGEIVTSKIEDGNTICDHGVLQDCDKQVAIAKEPVSSLGNNSQTSDRGGGDSVAYVVDQVHLGTDLGGGIGMPEIQDENIVCDGHVLPVCDKEADIAKEPLSNLDNSSLTSDRGGGESFAQVVGQLHLRSDLGGDISLSGIEDGNTICGHGVLPDCHNEVAIAKEPVSSLGNTSQSSDRDGGDSVAYVVEQVHLGSDLGGGISMPGIEDGNIISDGHVLADCEKKASIVKAPLFSLGNSSATSDSGRSDSVAQVVDQLHLGSDIGGEIGMSGIEDGSTICDRGVLPDCDKEAAIAKEPLSSLGDVTLTSDRVGGDSLVHIVDHLHLGSDLGGGIGIPGIEDGNIICDGHVLADCEKGAAIAKEPLSSLSNSSPTSDSGGCDSVDQVVGQLHSGSDLGIVGGNTFNDGHVLPDHDKEASNAKDGLECGDGPEEPVCDTLGGRLDNLDVMPHLGSDISSQTPQHEKDMVLQSGSEEDFRILDHSFGSLEFREGNTSDLCPSSAYIGIDNEPINERQDVKREHSSNSFELGNASTIECRVNRICFDEGQCESEMDSRLNDVAVDDQVPSEIEEAVAPSGSAAQNMPDNNADCDNTVGGSLLEAVCSGTMDNGPAKSLVMPGNCNAGTDGDTRELKCPNTSSLPLRRSSRSRKCVQKVEKGKNLNKFTKKGSKVSLHQTLDLLSEATRKKRSSLNRSICSAWGALESLLKYFQGSNALAVKQVIVPTSRKRKDGQRNRKKNKPKVSEFPEGRQEVLRRPIRLKVLFGKKEEPSKVDVMTPAVIDTSTGIQPCNDDKQLICSSFNESSGGDVMDSSAPSEMPKLVQCSNSMSNVQPTGANLEICSVSGKSNHDDSSQMEFQKPDRSCADKFSDPGTSPDSEVIDLVLDSTIAARDLATLHNSVNKDSCVFACPRSESLPASSKKSKSRRKKKDKFCQAHNPILVCQPSIDRAKGHKKSGQLQKLSNDICGSADNLTANSENPQSNTSSSELISMDLLPAPNEVSDSVFRLNNGADNAHSKLISGIESADSGNSCQLLPPAETQSKRNSKGSRTKGKSKNKSMISDASKSKPTPVTSRQKSKKKLTSKLDVREMSSLVEACKIGGQSGTGNHEVVDMGKTDPSNEVASKDSSCLDLMPAGIGNQNLAPRVAWVCCDDCLKWRCISAELADAIEETNCRWTCKDNQDQAFADCAIPQEKSNAEINAELQISDEEDGRGGLGPKSNGPRQSVALQPSTWMLIKANIFLHRSRKDQTMDEIMVCHCKPPKDGSLGCGSQCLNRMLNIECVQGTCPCGDLCSNQQFQRQQYVTLSWFRCGKKGYGLQVLQDIAESQFLIEYVGEVLDLHSYEARQKEYALKGHKHFYFMTLNGNEVIDASAKGNLGRFVNHSCDPNCRTEKWVVNGEICVGLFALRNIKKGEELTFDYNYVRVFGAAAKKCHCGSHKCRGYIGGDPLNAEVIVQADSDEEFPEPIVVKENGEIDYGLGDMMAKSSSMDVELLNRDNLVEEKSEVITEEKSEVIVEAGEMVDKVESTIDDSRQTEIVTEKAIADEIHESTDSSAGLQSGNLRNEPVTIVQNQTSRTEHTMSTPTSSPKSDLLLLENTTPKSLSGSIDSTVRVSKADVEHEPPHGRPRPRMKISRPSKSVKNRKSSENPTTVGKALITAHRSKFVSCKPKKLLEGSVNCHLEAVEEKLNELLDADGGICKKKDASKGYLKLLLLTATSGDSGNGGAIQSNRDLSMILDAMLKTKSRGVLLDVINKNGLQMLHNMMKEYRKDFKKIPILRKLLKVLEFLAEKEILTVERINKDSLHRGVESLRESILFFTEHEDNQVHQIARNFRDRWIPYSQRKFNRMDRNDRRRHRRGSNRHFGTSHHWREQGTVTERVTCSDQSGIVNNPADARMQEASTSQLIDSQTIPCRPRRRKSRWDQPARSPKKMRTSPKTECCEGGPTLAFEARKEKENSGAQNSDEDAPPGFSNPHNSVSNCPPGFSLSPKCPSVSIGLLQERYNPRIPVAYGIPLSVVQQFGTLKSGTVDSWAVAPAMPFLPFPPLPPYPRDRRQTGEREDGGSHWDQGMPSTSGESLSTVAINQNMPYHERSGRNFPGKRYYRQKRWNNSKPRLPWLRNLDGWGSKGNLGDVNHSVEYAGNSC